MAMTGQTEYAGALARLAIRDDLDAHVATFTPPELEGLRQALDALSRWMDERQKQQDNRRHITAAKKRARIITRSKGRR